MPDLIYRNINHEEVVRIEFNEGGFLGWCIQSKAEPQFKRKFATQTEACDVRNRECGFRLSPAPYCICAGSE